MSEPKYLILDMGKVLVAPTTGSWLITPTFIKNVNKESIDLKKLEVAIKNSRYILDKKAVNVEEEYVIIEEFYKTLFKNLNYNIEEECLNNIVRDFVYNEHDNKYYLYDDVIEELGRLSKKYKILMLSDNWPCAIDYLKSKDIYKYFDKVYISSCYGVKKSEKVFFDYPINDYNIKEGDAIFIDDNESLLDIAVTKGLNVMLMDRENEIKESKYKIINNLKNL